MFSRHIYIALGLGLILLGQCSGFSRWRRADNAQFPQGAGPTKPGKLDQSQEAGGGGGDAGAMSEDEIVQDYQPTGQNTTEQGMPPKYPLNVVSAEASAHDNEVSGCRDHTNASMICAKARNPCFCEEHETYMYSYCRRSCKYCDPETRTYHRYWRLRATSDFNPTWMVAEIEMYTQRGENTSLTLNSSSAYASSEYDGFAPRNAFDRSMFTTWMPAGWQDHSANDEWIAYEFPIPVNVKSVRLASNPQYPRSTPNKMVVEASDFRDGPFTQKWKIRNPDYVTDRIYNFIECPVLWRRLDAEFQTYCFRLITKYKTWPEARKECQEEGGELASITSDEELKFVLQDVRVCGFVWIGLNDRRREGFYEWADGKNTTYTRWPKGLYYDEVQRHYEDCVAMDPDGNWYTFVCQDKFHFICRKTLAEPKPPLPEEPPASEESPIIFLAPNYTLPVAARISPHPAAKEESERESYAELLTDVAVQQMKEKGFKPPMALANMIKPPADMSQKLVQITAQAEQKLKEMHKKFQQQQEKQKQKLKQHYQEQEQVHKQVNVNPQGETQAVPEAESEQENQEEGQQQQAQAQQPPQPPQPQQPSQQQQPPRPPPQPQPQQPAQSQQPAQQQPQPQATQQQAPEGEQEEPPQPQQPSKPNPYPPTIADNAGALGAMGPPGPPAKPAGEGGQNEQQSEASSSSSKENKKLPAGKVISITKVSKHPPAAKHKPHGPKGSKHASPDYAAGENPPKPPKGKNEKTIQVEKISLNPPSQGGNNASLPPRPEHLPIPPPSPPFEGPVPSVINPPPSQSGDDGSAAARYDTGNDDDEDKERDHEKVIRIGPNGNSPSNNEPPQPDDGPGVPDELRSPNENDEADSAQPAFRKADTKSHRRHKTAKVKESMAKGASKRHRAYLEKETRKKADHKDHTKAQVTKYKQEDLFKKDEDNELEADSESDEVSSGSASDEVESRRIEPEFEGLIRELI